MSGSPLAAALARGDVGRLLLRAPNWLGDAVMAWPVVAALERALPAGGLAVAARPAVAGLYEALAGVDRVLLWPARPGPAGLIGATRAVARGRFDAAVLLPNSAESALAPWLARVPHRVGFARFPRGPLLSEGLADGPRASLHARDRFLAIAEHLGLESDPVAARPALTPAARAAGEGLVAAAFGTPRPLAVLAPGAAYGGAKRWSSERFGELASALVERGMNVALAGSGADRTLALFATGGAPDAARVCDLRGRTSLAELAGLLGAAALVVANDSGTMHLAAALGTPTVGLFGSTDPAATGPRGPAVAVLRHAVACSPCGLRECDREAHHCMDALGTAEVVARATGLLDAVKGSVR